MAGSTLMYFSLSYCQYCKSFDKDWARTLSMLDAFRVPVRVRKVVCDRDRAAAEAYGVKSFPTILLQDPSGRVQMYKGTRESRDLFNWVTSRVGFPS